MTDLDRIELAIRRAASQMPNGAARTFRLLADEIQNLPKGHGTGSEQQRQEKDLADYRSVQREYD